LSKQKTRYKIEMKKPSWHLTPAYRILSHSSFSVVSFEEKNLLFVMFSKINTWLFPCWSYNSCWFLIFFFDGLFNIGYLSAVWPVFHALSTFWISLKFKVCFCFHLFRNAIKVSRIWKAQKL
jgi:hypothetical protein